MTMERKRHNNIVSDFKALDVCGVHSSCNLWALSKAQRREEQNNHNQTCSHYSRNPASNCRLYSFWKSHAYLWRKAPIYNWQEEMPPFTLYNIVELIMRHAFHNNLLCDESVSTMLISNFRDLKFKVEDDLVYTLDLDRSLHPRGVVTFMTKSELVEYLGNVDNQRYRLHHWNSPIRCDREVHCSDSSCPGYDLGREVHHHSSCPRYVPGHTNNEKIVCQQLHTCDSTCLV